MNERTFVRCYPIPFEKLCRQGVFTPAMKAILTYAFIRMWKALPIATALANEFGSTWLDRQDISNQLGEMKHASFYRNILLLPFHAANNPWISKIESVETILGDFIFQKRKEGVIGTEESPFLDGKYVFYTEKRELTWLPDIWMDSSTSHMFSSLRTCIFSSVSLNLSSSSR